MPTCSSGRSGKRTCAVRNGDVRNASDVSSAGYGVRALVDGSWGFFGSDRFDDAAFDAAAARAAALAKSGTKVSRSHPRGRSRSEKIVAHYETPMTKDPAQRWACRRAPNCCSRPSARGHVAKNVISALRVHDDLHDGQGVLLDDRQRDHATAAPSRCRLRRRRRSAATKTCRRAAARATSRSIRAAATRWSSARTCTRCMPEYGREAVILADAPPLPSGVRDLILDGSVLNLQMHESIGHPLELDRALGWEANFSGVSWATPDQVGKLRYGSDLLNVYADNALPLGHGNGRLRRRRR